MRPFRPALPIAALLLGLTTPAFAAGNGAGAGGSGFQRAINSGLPAGEPGPLGSVNNPHRTVTPPPAMKDAPHPEPATEKSQ